MLRKEVEIQLQFYVSRIDIRRFLSRIPLDVVATVMNFQQCFVQGLCRLMTLVNQVFMKSLHGTKSS